MKFPKIQKNRYFQRVYSKLFVKEWNFFSREFLGKSRERRSIFDILDKKESSQHQKSLKRRYFAKGLVHSFSQTK